MNEGNISWKWWSSLFLLFVVVPALFVYIGLQSLIGQVCAEKRSQAQITFERFFAQVSRVRDPELFWGQLLNEWKDRLETSGVQSQSVEQELAGIAEWSGTTPEVLCFSKTGQRLYGSAALLREGWDHPQVFRALSDAANPWQNVRKTAGAQERFQLLRDLLGKMYVPGLLRRSMGDPLGLTAPLDEKQSRWVYFNNIGQLTLLVFLAADAGSKPYALLKDMHELLPSISSDFGIALYHRSSADQVDWSRLASSGPLTEDAAQTLIRQAHKDFWSFHDGQRDFQFVGCPSARERVVMTCGKDFFSVHAQDILYFTVIFFAVLGTIILIGISQYLKRNPTVQISLIVRLAFLFFFANGLPLITLGFLGYDYQGQKRLALREEMRNHGIDLLHNVDRRFPEVFGRIEIQLTGIVDELQQRLREASGLTADIGRWLNQKMEFFGTDRFYLVASEARSLLTHAGLYSASPKDNSFREADNNTVRLSQYFLADANNKVKDDLRTTMTREMVESLMQKSMVELGHAFLDSLGVVMKWGFGTNPKPGFVDFFEVFTRGQRDYFFLALFNDFLTQESYLRNTLLRANRNPTGIRLYAYNAGNKPWRERFLPVAPEITQATARDLVRHLDSVGRFPTPLGQPIDMDGECYQILGQQGGQLDNFVLLALVPESRIEEALRADRMRVVTLLLLNLVATIFLIAFMARRFLTPMRALAEGAEAIGTRRFEHRIPVLGSNELGNMALIFNRVMEDSEDLKIAGLVQNSLFPSDNLHIPGCGVAGRSVTMRDLGGDYYDFFTIGQNQVGVLIGDVSGHGVPAALVMAAVKCVVMQRADLWSQPRELLEYLHALLRAIRSEKGGLFMSFQYLCLDLPTGIVNMGNAGHCRPIWVQPTRQQSEYMAVLSMPLGGGRIARVGDRSWQLNPGDYIYMYTDGFVEALTEPNKILGFEGFQKLLGCASGTSAENILEEAFATHRTVRLTEEAQDDLTMAVVLYDGPIDNTGKIKEIAEQ